MLVAPPLSPNLVDALSKTWQPAAIGEDSQFQQSLARAASIQEGASSAADRVALAPSESVVQRAIPQASPRGERVLQGLSAMSRTNLIPSVVDTAPAVAVSRVVQPGPAAQPLLQQQGESRAVGGPEGVGNFESAMANLRDVYSDVIQVSLVSKSASAVSSSLNKLLSSG
ncbi:nodulation protein NolB [Bradyrhizobium sp. WSM3983]|uniref:nodulation protein NolB n=1 Tax=Bradyrhizobium sp. WSM3983 TaxID=1038867 RepID=UPI0018DEB932|nr:nodulation protein NolB [Bradyrhizobium sp. WSM3983]